MTESDIKHYLALGKRVESASFIWSLFTLAFLINAYFQIYDMFSAAASLLLSGVFAYNAFSAFLNSSENAKSYHLIAKLVNRDPDLVKQISLSRNV